MSFKQIHGDNKREADLQKAEGRRASEQKRRLDVLKKKESDIENEMAKVQGLGGLSELNDQLRVVRQEVDRLQREMGAG